MTIPDKATRGAVACVIWWDWFSQRTGDMAWPHLDALVNKSRASDVSEHQLHAGLIKVGYTKQVATVRVFCRGRSGSAVPRPSTRAGKAPLFYTKVCA